jgi:hypothetical protein
MVYAGLAAFACASSEPREPAKSYHAGGSRTLREKCISDRDCTPPEQCAPHHPFVGGVPREGSCELACDVVPGDPHSNCPDGMYCGVEADRAVTSKGGVCHGGGEVVIPCLYLSDGGREEGWDGGCNKP